MLRKILRCLGCRKTNTQKYFKNFEHKDINDNSLNIGESNKEETTPDNLGKKNMELKKKNNSDQSENNKSKKGSLITDEDDSKNMQIPEEMNKKFYNDVGLNIKNSEDIGEDELLILSNSSLILPYEKDVKFTKKGLVEIWDNFWALGNFKRIWDKDDLIIEVRNEGTFLSAEYYLIKIIFRVNKNKLNNNTDLDTVLAFFYDPKIRPTWDQVIKEIRIYEGNPFNSYVHTMLAKKPVFFMTDRESLEKKFIFKNKKGDILYVMASSIPDEIHPSTNDVVRLTNYCNYFKIVDEGDYIGYYSLNQSDFKMPIPQFLVNMGLPSTTKTWYDSMVKFSGKVTYDKNSKTIIENNNNNNNNNEE